MNLLLYIFKSDMLKYLIINNFIVKIFLKKNTLGLIIFIHRLTQTRIETQSSHLILQSYLMKSVRNPNKTNPYYPNPY